MGKLFLRRLLLFASVIMGLSCTSMDHHYEDFWGLANRIYVGKVDSIKAFPGKNRMQLTWKRSPDPTVSDVMVYWNNRADSLLTSIDGLESAGWLATTVQGLSEDTHLFEVYALDQHGNRSIPVEIVARVYGDVYENSLINRVIRNQEVDGESLTISWFEDGEPTLLGTEIHYTDNHQVNKVVYKPSNENTVVINQVDFQREIKYRSLFRPDTLAIDSFYTSFSPISIAQ